MFFLLIINKPKKKVQNVPEAKLILLLRRTVANAHFGVDVGLPSN